MSKKTEEIVLVFYADGTAQLLIEDESEWASDFDDDFREEFEDEKLTVEDADDILEYLEDAGYLDPGESASVAIDEEVPDNSNGKEPLEADSEDGTHYEVTETDFGHA